MFLSPPTGSHHWDDVTSQQHSGCQVIIIIPAHISFISVLHCTSFLNKIFDTFAKSWKSIRGNGKNSSLSLTVTLTAACEFFSRVLCVASH